MASINEILGKQINSIKELKAEIKSLQDSLIGVDAESEQYKKTAAQLAAAQDELTKVTRAGKDENIAAKDSIVGMTQEYKKLYDQYKLLTEEQRNSDFGKNMAQSLDEMSKKLNETKQGVGDFKNNIGNYAGSISDAFSKMGISVGALQGPIKTANVAFKGLNTTMKANPIGLVIAAITALIALFKKVREAVSQNEEHQMRWNEAMAKFQPIVDAAKNALDFLAGVMVDYVEFLGKAVQKIREFGAAVTDFLGITKGAKKELQEQQKIYDDIVATQNKLTKQKREYQKLDAQDKARVEQLREEASAATTLEEKQRLLTEAKEIQAEIDNRAIEIAQEELRVLEEQAQLTANDAEMNDKLAAATAKVSQAQAQAASNAAKFNKEMGSSITTTVKATTATHNYREEAKKLYEELVENNKDEITKLTEKYNKEKKLLEKYHYDTTLLTKQYQDKLAVIVKEKDKQRRETYLSGLQQTREDYQAEMELILKRSGEFVATAEQQTFLQGTIIPAVHAIRKEIDDILASSIDEDTLNEVVNLLNTEGFAALGEEYDGLKEKIENVNAQFGLSISTLKNLDITIENLNDKNNELLNNLFSANFAETTAERLVAAYEFAFDELQELGIGSETNNIFDPGNWSFDFIKKGMLEKEYELLEEQKQMYEDELENFRGTQEQKLEILQRYYETVEEMEERHRALSELNQQRTQEMVENLADAMDNIGSSLNTVKSSYETLIDSEVKAGKIDEQQAKEKKKRLAKLEIAQQAFAIATIAADAATGLFSIWKGYANEVGTVNPQTAAATGPLAAGTLAALNTKSLVSAIAKSAGLAATATAQIMAARNGIVVAANSMNGESSSSSAGASVGASPVLIDSTPYSYSRTVQTQDEIDEINNHPVWVSVVDIESGLGQRAQVVGESSF